MAPNTGAGVPLCPGRGIVEAFDDARGLGMVRTDQGVGHPFHCTAIADGTRTIEVGTEVTYRVAPGRLGRWEASDLRTVGTRV